jgi:hypothetical protein
MNIIYKITYLPHLNTSYPKYYIGSKLNYKGNYFGSIASRKKLEFTEGVSLKDWWKKQYKHNPNAFQFEILEDCSMLNKYQLAEKEKEYQLKHNAVLSLEFFNQAIATGLFVGGKKDDETKTKMSASLKKFYQTPEGLEKRKRLIERNKRISSNIMKEKWKKPSDKMLNKVITGRPKGVKDKTKRNKNFRQVFDGFNVYKNAEIAAKIYGITPTSIRRRCRLNFNNVWRYCE